MVGKTRQIAVSQPAVTATAAAPKPQRQPKLTETVPAR